MKQEDSLSVQPFSGILNSSSDTFPEVVHTQKNKIKKLRLLLLQSIYHVFDGHLGASAADYSSIHLSHNIVSFIENGCSISVLISY